MDHAGDNVGGGNSDYASCINVVSVDYTLASVLGTTLQSRGLPMTASSVGITVRNIGGANIQACGKTSAVGGYLHPVLNTPTADVASGFTDQCTGTYVMLI